MECQSAVFAYEVFYNDLNGRISEIVKPQIFLESFQPGMLLPVHPGEVKWYDWHFWTGGDFCDLGQQADLCTKTILVTGRFQQWKNKCGFEISPTLTDSCHMIVPDWYNRILIIQENTVKTMFAMKIAWKSDSILSSCGF